MITAKSGNPGQHSVSTKATRDSDILFNRRLCKFACCFAMDFSPMSLRDDPLRYFWSRPLPLPQLLLLRDREEDRLPFFFGPFLSLSPLSFSLPHLPKVKMSARA